MLDDATIRAWRETYNLDRFSPEQAMRWWVAHFDGKAPAGAVAALGLCLQEIERLRDELTRLDMAAHAQATPLRQRCRQLLLQILVDEDDTRDEQFNAGAIYGAAQLAAMLTGTVPSNGGGAAGQEAAVDSEGGEI